MSGQGQHAYPALDGLRGAAAIAVVLHHFPPLGQPGLFGNGLLAVDLFFVISGFVLASAYDGKLAVGLGAPAFMRARYVRLWPVLALGVAAGLAQVLLAPIPAKDLALSAGGRIACAGFGLAILPCPLPSPELFPTDPPEWSLFYELAANLLFALAFVPLLKARRLLALIGAAGGVLLLGILHFRGASFGGGLHALPFQLGRVGFSFFLGVLLHRTRTIWTPRLPRLSPWAIFLVLLVLLAVPTPRTLDIPVHLFAILAACPLLVSLAALAPAQGRTARICLAAGAVSYPLYALHLPLVFLGRSLAAGWRLSPGLLDALLISGVIGLSLLIVRFYETPVRRWLAWLLDRPAMASLPAERPLDEAPG
jgi:peptidoglycan/LPS O-acetylase OafA/YrhL